MIISINEWRKFKLNEDNSTMKNYLITFVTLDGNEQGVYVSATSKERAILKFENEYEFEAIKFCEEDRS